ncbi:hypothetical protein MO973_20165 [Paenibacillus sp. TRM 82003]|nr:hypothetical protein [Paenibacillus sp. TRM 82003]
MARKWERMVEKNRKRLNVERQRSGQSAIGSETDAPIKGRSWVFPLLLATAGLLFAFTMPEASGDNILYQITVGLYLLLALFHYLVRRPYLKVSKGKLTWRVYSGDRTVPAGEIAGIDISDHKSVVRLKDGKTKRSFSKVYHLYPMDRINEALRSFANANHIPINGQAKES